jgi:hypothetical protein
MSHQPYREPAAIDSLVLSNKDRLVLFYRAAREAPRVWWDGLSDAARIFAVLALFASLLTAIVVTLAHADPCNTRITAKVHGVTPEGLPAEYVQSWCAEYKPGRGP